VGRDGVKSGAYLPEYAIVIMLIAVRADCAT